MSELCYGMDNRDESLWVRVRGEASNGGIVVAVCYRPPGQDEAFLKQLKDISGSQTLVLMGYFNLPDICQHSGTQAVKEAFGGCQG